MKRLLVLFLCGATGCSTNPFVDMKDYFKPGRMYTDQVGRYGGVCQPQGLLPGGPGPVGNLTAPGVPTPIVPPAQIPPPTPGAPLIPPAPGTVEAPFPTVPSGASPIPALPQ